MSPYVGNAENRGRMAFSTSKPPLSGEHWAKKKIERKPCGRRRVFVQTETGRVMGIELDRDDNAHTVKRKLRVALNVPTEESSLTYGDLVLKNDLSAVQNDSPLLLTRNVLHRRSSSTPCLSENGKDLQLKDRSGPIEILVCSNQHERTRHLVVEIVQATNNGIDPVPVCSGLGGAYYFRNVHGENIAIVKPTDEEPYAPNNPKGFVGKALGQPGLKRSVRVGETGFREVAAYLLDYDHFANVPPTALVKVTHSIFNVNDGVKGNADPRKKQVVSKIASLQQFIPHDFDASDHGTSSFPVDAVHRIGILDIRILNTDRHAGNLLVRKLDGVGSFGQVELVPIDHGFCLPESLEDPYFEWIHWPQASIPFSQDELEYINRLDPFRDSDMLRTELPMIREACLRVLVLCTIFLKEAADFGLCLAEIGEMMSREFRCCEEEPSELELISMEARRLLEDEKTNNSVAKMNGKEDFQYDTDCEGHERSLLYKLEESGDENDEDSEKIDKPPQKLKNHASNALKLSNSTKNTNTGEKSWRSESAMQKKGYLAGSSSRNRSASEQLSASNSFAKLADMTEEEWTQFLEYFRGLLCPAFANRKSASLSQRQRLGTSCQF